MPAGSATEHNRNISSLCMITTVAKMAAWFHKMWIWKKKKKCCLWLCSCVEMFQLKKTIPACTPFLLQLMRSEVLSLQSPCVRTQRMVIFSATSWIAIKRDWIYPDPSPPHELPQSYIHTGHVCFCLVDNVSLCNALDSQNWQCFMCDSLSFCFLKYEDGCSCTLIPRGFNKLFDLHAAFVFKLRRLLS